MIFYSPTAFSFLTFSFLTSFIYVLSSLFSLCGSWSVVLVADLCTLPISLLSVTQSLYSSSATSSISLLLVTQSLYSLAATSPGHQWWLRFGPILGFVVLSSNLWWWMLLFFWILWWICGSPLVTDFGFCGCCCFLGLWISMGLRWFFYIC